MLFQDLYTLNLPQNTRHLVCAFSYRVETPRDEKIFWASYQVNLGQSLRFETIKDIVSKEGFGNVWITIEVVV